MTNEDRLTLLANEATDVFELFKRPPEHIVVILVDLSTYLALTDQMSSPFATEYFKSIKAESGAIYPAMTLTNNNHDHVTCLYSETRQSAFPMVLAFSKDGPFGKVPKGKARIAVWDTLYGEYVLGN